MESFNDLLQKLQETHDREVEGWQVKVKELSNKKGCDSKRMEELFSRNQQMKEQQRLLTENIKTLENRLRAGLCDRCTVTQEVAKRKQQEYEASHIHSLQHISLLAGEMTNLKKENLKLKDELRKLRAAQEKVLSDASSSNNSGADVKPIVSPALSPSPGVVALLSPAASRTSTLPADGDVVIKAEAELRGEEAERSRHSRGATRSSFEVFKPQPLSAVPSWKMEHSVPRVGDRIVEGFEPHSSVPVQTLRKNSSSSAEVKPSRHVVHAPIPCHPQPIKNSHMSLPWTLSEPSSWANMAAAGTGPVTPTSSRLHLPRFPNLVPPISQASARRPGFVSPWKTNSHQPPVKEPTVVFKVRRVPDYPESGVKTPEKKESPPPKCEEVSGEVLREPCDGPLDLSDRGKSKPNQSPCDYAPVLPIDEAGVRRSPDNGVSPPTASPSVVVLPSPSASTPAKKQEHEPSGDLDNEVTERDHEQEADGKTDQSNDKKVPVLTLSLRPAVVRLETLNSSSLQKPESISANGKQKCVTVDSPRASTASSANETESSLDEQEDEGRSGKDGNQSCKRKRASVETETDRDSDTNNVHQERRIKITVRAEEKSPS